MAKNSSELLLSQFLNSSPGGSAELFDRYHHRVVDLARRKLRGFLRSKVDPQDIAQESLLTLFQSAKEGRIRLQKPGDLWRFISGIVNNKVKQQFERFNLGKRDVSREQLGRIEALFATDGDTNTDAFIDEILRDENPDVRSIVTMILQGFSRTEIANSLNCSTRTIRRVTEKLRDRLVGDLQLPLASRDLRSFPPVIGEPAHYSDFLLLKMIGMGDFAKVYLARNKSNGQLFAFKAVRKKWLSNSIVHAAFVNEIFRLMAIDDPAIVKTHGWGKLPNGGMFVLLHWVEGEPLEKCLPHSSRFERRRWFAQMESVVQRLHRLGIAHRDLNLRNFMITETKKVVLIDFAFSRRIRSLRADQNEDLEALRRLQYRLNCL